MNIKKFLVGFSASAILMVSTAIPALADSVSVDFENPPYTLGVINGQDGWSSLGAAGSGCAVYDHEVDNSLSTTGFGLQSLRISNAVTSGCFGDMTFTKPLINSVGEADATAGTFSAGTKQTHFEMQFDIASAVPGAQQPGLFMSVSPDRGDGSRMSYVGFDDVAGGIDIIFYDVQGTSNPASFVLTDLGTYSRTPHTIKLVMDVVDGPSNDVVKVYIDGTLVHTGTSWENYYRYDSEASAEQSPRIVKSAIFRTGGGAAPGTAGNGYLIDNLSLLSSQYPTSGLITNPAANGDHVSGIVNLTATYDDGDAVNDDAVQWAVRHGTCAAATNTEFGNVDGHSDPSTWDGSSFSASIDTTGLVYGDSYCFVFNPTDDPGQNNVRETRTFIVDEPFIGPPADKNECKNGGWETFNNPEFKNQGDCVSYVQSNENAEGNRKDN